MQSDVFLNVILGVLMLGVEFSIIMLGVNTLSVIIMSVFVQHPRRAMPEPTLLNLTSGSHC
jgi:hypothetical protein